MYARAISMSCDRRIYALSRPIARAAERIETLPDAAKTRFLSFHLYSAVSLMVSAAGIHTGFFS